MHKLIGNKREVFDGIEVQEQGAPLQILFTESRKHLQALDLIAASKKHQAKKPVNDWTEKASDLEIL
jgi:hypothetical protein